jgi:ankyrin repeat protein
VVVKLLLELGADVNVQGGKYGNALNATSLNGDLEVMSWLLDKGANVNPQSSSNRTALQAASWAGHWELYMVVMLYYAG